MMNELKFIETDYYNEWISFEYKGIEFTRDLHEVVDNFSGVKGSFEFKQKDYLFNKTIVDGERNINITMK